MIKDPTLTLADAIAVSLRRAAEAFHAGAEEPPAVVLWTDPDRHWEPIVEPLLALMPELLVLGELDSKARSGPAIWLKTALAGSIEGIALPKDRTPVFYLPGVSRHELRNADQCSWDVQPLVELLYRGLAWTHKNGRDWSVEGFFVAEEGLGLDLAQDERTRLSLHTALGALAGTPLSRLQGKRLEASDFDSLMVGDTPRDLLLWIGLGDAAKTQWKDDRWHAFRSRCQDEFGFDPDKEGPLYAAERLGKREDRWSEVWGRLCEAPAMYGGVRERLDQAQPGDVLAFDAEPWPGENTKLERKLGVDLEKLAEASPHDARDRIVAMDETHGPRRGWVWAKLNESPLAMGLRPLRELADATRAVPSFASLDEFSAWYAGSGWTADLAALDSLAATYGTEGEKATIAAVRAIYAPWLEEVCLKFQELAADGIPVAPAIQVNEGECLLFVDGLRFDLACRLEEHLQAEGKATSIKSRYSALPTVTATAKPAVSPVSGEISGNEIPPSFEPLDSSGKALTTARLRSMIEQAGFQRVEEDNPAPASSSSRGWCETGRIDHRGHDLGAELATQYGGELDRVVSHINALLSAGWSSVTVVTDHGWLLLPGGLEKYELPGFLVESRWSRCAAIKGQSVPDTPVVAWRWNGHEHVAVAPGAKSFKGGIEYSHGGVSPQECVLPVIRITSDGVPVSSGPSIAGVKWRRQRCTVEVANPVDGLMADLRIHANDAGSSVLAAPKEVESDGEVSLLVADESLEGKTVTVVLLTESGELVAQTSTKVGG